MLMAPVFCCLMATLAAKEVNLANRLKLHDPQAIADLYDIYGRLVFVLIARIVHDPALAEDLMQETFLRAWNRSAQLHAEHGAVGPWLVAVARNCALDYLKSSEAHLRDCSEDVDASSMQVSMESNLLHADLARAMRAAFAELSPMQRQVIELAYYQGLSQSEIALSLQQPLGSVKSWTRTALHKLREELGEPFAHLT
jgi:RNA polymerase sigma-70 factor (ECF subfamily)